MWQGCKRNPFGATFRAAKNIKPLRKKKHLEHIITVCAHVLRDLGSMMATNCKTRIYLHYVRAVLQTQMSEPSSTATSSYTVDVMGCSACKLFCVPVLTRERWCLKVKRKLSSQEVTKCESFDLYPRRKICKSHALWESMLCEAFDR